MEATAIWWLDQIGWIPRHTTYELACAVDVRKGANQRPGIGVGRPVEYAFHAALLHQFACIHDGYLVTSLSNH